jgi:hypothetical protein
MKIIPALTGPMSGKLGGMVASRNRGGQYFRRKAVPINPDTNLQTARRSVFATLISQYNNGLTPAERASWTNWAANTPRIDSLGQTHVLTGQNAFVGYNALRIQGGGALVTTNTGVYNRGESARTVSLIASSATAWDLNVAFSADTSEAGDLLVFLGRPQNPSVEFYKGPYRFAQAEAIAANTDIAVVDIGNINALPFPAVVGEKLPIKLVMVYDDGRYTDAVRFLTVIPAFTP